MKAVSVLALAAAGVASPVEAQTSPNGQVPNAPSQAQQMPVRTAPDGSFRDECGFRYNSRGDRIDARGRVLPPPRTPSGGRSCR